MASACELIDAELALDRLDGMLAGELPAHMRAFALAHAAGEAVPPAPDVAMTASAIETVRRACAHAELADRGLGLLRLLAPLAIESDLDVVRARSIAPSWAGYVSLMAARDRASVALFGHRAIDLLHRLHGVDDRDVDLADLDGEPVDGGASTVTAMLGTWYRPGQATGEHDLDRAWELIADTAKVRGRLHIQRSSARSRAFIVEPGREIVVIVPAVIDTPAKRFAVLHELGHAVCGLSSKVMAPRVLDEAVASLVGRLMEGTTLDVAWRSAVAAPVRERRLALSMKLDRMERAGVMTTGSIDSTELPPWSMWNDPGAQASYVEAETIADRLHLESIGDDITRERLRIDGATRL